MNPPTQSGKDAGRPEDLSAERGQEQQATHPFAEAVLQRIQHRNVALLSHRISKEHPACNETFSSVNLCRRRGR